MNEGEKGWHRGRKRRDPQKKFKTNILEVGKKERKKKKYATREDAGWVSLRGR